MLRKLCVESLNATIKRNLRQKSANKLPNISNPTPYDVIDTRNIPSDDFIDAKFKKKSVLETCTEDISHVAPYLRPTFNFAAYVNKSDSLQQLLRLGVNLHKLEQMVNVPQLILGLDFERDIKKYVTFLHDLGASVDEIGNFITKNPYILKENLDDLRVRVNYLEAKKFQRDAILRIVVKNPFWLVYSTQRIDRRLGFFQTHFSLQGNEVRALAAKQPKLITYSLKSVKLNTFVLKEEMGFTDDEIKRMLLNKPKIFMTEQRKSLKTFEYIHKVMKIPLEVIVEFPDVLTCREIRVKQRHLFLEKLGKVQYDPKMENYIAISTLVSGSDCDFCVNVARTSVNDYNMFLKSM